MFKKRRPPVGARPGSLNIDACGLKPKVRVVHFNENKLSDREIEDVEELKGILADSDDVLWVSVDGFGDEKVIRRVGEIFQVHPLAIADAVNVPSRPKLEDYDSYCFIITSAAMMEKNGRVSGDQISIIVGSKFVLTFQEKYSDVLDSVRQRLDRGIGQIRKCGADYLATSILDTIIDGYYPVLEELGEYLEKLEIEVIDRPSRQTLKKIYRLKRELLNLRRSLWPTREAVSGLVRGDCALISHAVIPYLRDCYDHCVQMIDVLETYRELAAGFMDVYLSGLSNRLNEVMKVLTIISTIFIPLSFFASIYGMNFHHMPELEYKWSYPVFWIFILATALVMVRFFRKKGWLETTEVAASSRAKAQR